MPATPSRREGGEQEIRLILSNILGGRRHDPRGQGRVIRLSGVRAVKSLPDRVEVHTGTAGCYVIHLQPQQVNILSKGLSRHRRGRRVLATFLYFPDGDGATVLVEERGGRCTLVINELASAGVLA